MSNTNLSGAPPLDNVEFIGLLGVGGMSRVYKARQKLLDRIVAVKVLSSSAIGESGFQRFEIEAKLTSSLSHPNIVQIMSYGIASDGQAYIVMEYLEGQTLSKVIADSAPISFRRFQKIFLPLLSALEQAHSKGIIHRDIKPSNIILCQDKDGGEIAKLVDFGIAKIFSDGAEFQNSVSVTRTGNIVGSPTYMSPEQCQGAELDHRTDLYSLSCVMFETLNCEPPFVATSSFDVMYKHMHEPLIKTRELSARMEIPEVLAQAILWGLKKEPGKRPESASKFAAKLARALDEVTLDRQPRLSKIKRKSKTGSPIQFTVGVVLITILSCFALLLIRQDQQKKTQTFELKTTVSADQLVKNARELAYSKAAPREGYDLCEKAIAMLKQKGAPSSLAEAYWTQAFCVQRIRAIEGKLFPALAEKCVVDLESAAFIEKSLSREKGFFMAIGDAIAECLEMQQYDRALDLIEKLKKTEKLNDGNRSWFFAQKLRCLLEAKRYIEAEKVGRELLNSKDFKVRNGNFYLAWMYYADSLNGRGRKDLALNEQSKLASALVADGAPNPPDRVSVFERLETLKIEQPALFLRFLKDELSVNAAMYQISIKEECKIRRLMGQAYTRLGETQRASAQYLLVIHKIEKSYSSISEPQPLLRSCLGDLIDLSKDDVALQQEYKEELERLDAPTAPRHQPLGGDPKW